MSNVCSISISSGLRNGSRHRVGAAVPAAPRRGAASPAFVDLVAPVSASRALGTTPVVASRPGSAARTLAARHHKAGCGGVGRRPPRPAAAESPSPRFRAALDRVPLFLPRKFVDFSGSSRLDSPWGAGVPPSHSPPATHLPPSLHLPPSPPAGVGARRVRPWRWHPRHGHRRRRLLRLGDGSAPVSAGIPRVHRGERRYRARERQDEGEGERERRPVPPPVPTTDPRRLAASPR